MPTKGRDRIWDFVKKDKVLSITILVMIAAIAMVAASFNPLKVMSECYQFGVFPPGRGEVVPGSSYSITCDYKQNIGQDLIFWARITQGPDVIALPSHVEIRDPDNKMVVSENHNSSTVIVYVKPESFGVYNATITSLDSSVMKVPSDYRRFVSYGFGHLTSTFEGVRNPAGDTFYAMNIWGYTLISLSVMAFVFVGVRAAYKSLRKSSKESSQQ